MRLRYLQINKAVAWSFIVIKSSNYNAGKGLSRSNKPGRAKIKRKK
jgi:hypothetical protein